jgi:hypothetical protein
MHLFWCGTPPVYACSADACLLFRPCLLAQNWCRNACASSWLDITVLSAIILNTILLAVENPANQLTDDTLHAMVITDLVLTVRNSILLMWTP